MVAVAGGLRSGVLPGWSGPRGRGRRWSPLGVVAVALVGAFHDDPFVLLLMARALLVLVACLGLHVQLADAGVPNFAGAAFFGVGGYTAAVLARGALPHLAGAARQRRGRRRWWARCSCFRCSAPAATTPR